MKHRWLLAGGMCILASLATVGCKKTTCEKYADMEVKCGGIPEKEADLTRALAKGMCSETPPAGAEEFSSMIKKEAACADKTSDCAAYKTCVDALKSTK
jgi:hypothetical protein